MVGLRLFREGSLGKVSKPGTGIAPGIYILTVQSDGQTIYNERVIVNKLISRTF